MDILDEEYFKKYREGTKKHNIKNISQYIFSKIPKFSLIFIFIKIASLISMSIVDGYLSYQVQAYIL
jgi:hypothetical protein